MAHKILPQDIFQSRDEVINLTNALLDRSLPKIQWTHAAHLVAAYELLHRYSLEELSKLIPNIIRRYNEATNTPNSDTDGYHETITKFYIQAIDHLIKNLPDGTGYMEGCHALITGPYGKADFPLDYYSKERLFSVTARRQWQAPDIKPLDF